MRIAFATGIYPPDIGGPATYVSHLARDLFDQGWGVRVITYGADAGETSPFPVQHVARSAPLPLRYLSFLTAVRRAAPAEELVYAQDPLSSGLPAYLAARSRRRPFVVKIVGDLAWEIGSEQGRVKDDIQSFQGKACGPVIGGARRAQRFVARNADRVVVPSEYLKRLVSGWGVSDERIDVVPNSLPEIEAMRSSKAEARRELSFGTELVLLSAGRLVPWKGFDRLIRMMPDLLPVLPSARLFIIGSGPCESELKGLAAQLNLGDKVRFVGPVDRKGMQLRLLASDVLVHASSYEGFPHLLLEAMRAELPIVAMDAGGNRELVENDASGVLVPLNETQRFTEALVHVCQDRTLRARLVSGGAARAKEFGWERMVDATTKVLQRASRSRARADSRAEA